MDHSMISASVTMNSLMRKLDILSNNLANMGTDGFKKQEASFQDTLTYVKQQHAKQQLPGRITSPGSGITIGSGARIGQVYLNMAQGSLRPTGNSLDLAIEGDALFEIGLPAVDENGDPTYNSAWTKNGAFQLSTYSDEEVMLTAKDGSPVMSTGGIPILLPAGRDITIDANGEIYAASDDPASPPIFVGQMKIVRAVNPQLLVTRGDNLFVLPPNLAGRADQLMEQLDLTNLPPGEMPVHVRQGYLEGSNVDLATEMSELIELQRAFQLNARALTSSDQMMDITNRLRS